jgi:predicted histone-like DNA-binding protein
MAIQYRISRRKNNIATNSETNYILQAVSTGEIDIERLSYEISTESTLSETDVRAVLDALGRKMRQHLEDGKTVSLENIGRFKIGFKSVAQPNKSLLRTAEVSKFHINYQPSVKLKRWLKKGIALKKEKTKK